MRTLLPRRALPAVTLLAGLGTLAACGQAAAPAGGSTATVVSSPTTPTTSPTTTVTTGAPTTAATTPGAPTTGAPTTGAPTTRASTTDAGAGASVTAHGVRLDVMFTVGFPEQPTGPGMRKRPGVLVSYTLTRVGTPGSNADLVAYDVVPDSLGSASLPAGVNPEHAWVYADGATVRISKQGFATAPGIAFAAAPTMGARPIPTDAPLAGRAYAVTPPELALPGSEFTAPRTALAAGSSSFSFCVQVGDKTGGLRPALAVDGMGGVLQAPVRAPAGDELVCTPPVTLTTP